MWCGVCQCRSKYADLAWHCLCFEMMWGSGGCVQDLHNCWDHAECSHIKSLDYLCLRASWLPDHAFDNLVIWSSPTCLIFTTHWETHPLGMSLLFRQEAVSKHMIAVSTNLKVCCPPCFAKCFHIAAMCLMHICAPSTLKETRLEVGGVCDLLWGFKHQKNI
jgi:hypothetical protein